MKKTISVICLVKEIQNNKETQKQNVWIRNTLHKCTIMSYLIVKHDFIEISLIPKRQKQSDLDRLIKKALSLSFILKLSTLSVLLRPPLHKWVHGFLMCCFEHEISNSDILWCKDWVLCQMDERTDAVCPDWRWSWLSDSQVKHHMCRVFFEKNIYREYLLRGVFDSEGQLTGREKRVYICLKVSYGREGMVNRYSVITQIYR